MLQRIADGRTDLVFEYLAQGNSPDSALEHCLYYGDVSAIKYLLSQGATLRNLELTGPSFHGHWRLVQFLLEQGADANAPDPQTDETPLHSALCTTDRIARNRVLQVLLAAGADPNRHTLPNAETGAFMRDCRTKGETPLHRAAAFGDAEAIQLLLKAGAVVHAKDMHGDSPLSWASWYARPAHILRLLCYGPYRIRPDYTGMDTHLQGNP